MWRIWWTPNNASKWQMGFNLAFKGLSTTPWRFVRTGGVYPNIYNPQQWMSGQLHIIAIPLESPQYLLYEKICLCQSETLILSHPVHSYSVYTIKWFAYCVHNKWYRQCAQQLFFILIYFKSTSTMGMYKFKCCAFMCEIWVWKKICLCTNFW